MDTRKIELSLADILQLDSELSGNADFGLKGLLSCDMPFKLKYKLNKIAKQARTEALEYNTIRNEAVKKYGETKDGESFVVMPKIKGEQSNMIDNPRYKDFHKEMASVLEIKKDIQVLEDISLSDLEDIKISEHYPVFMDIIKE